MISRLAVSVGALALVGAAFGQSLSVVVNAAIPYTDTNWSQNLVIPQFNVPSAHLDSVEIAFQGDVKSSIKLENRDEEPIDYTASASYVLNLKGLSGATLLLVKPVIAPQAGILAAYDGTLDFAGTSGISFLDIMASSSGSTSLTSEADLAAFTGAGTVILPVDASASSAVSGSGNMTKIVRTQASAGIVVTYHYTIIPQLGSLGDRIWFDANANGKQDEGEHGAPGLGVKLLDAAGTVLKTTTTDSDGIYLFEDLPAADYRVELGKPSGYVYTVADAGLDDLLDSDVDASGLSPLVTLGAGEDRLDIDAGLVGTLCLGDRVWKDLDRDGLQDSCEPGVPGVPVHLLDANGNVVADTVTGANGIYKFTNLAPGDYTVEFDAPSGFGFTKQFANANYKQYDSNVDPLTGKATVNLAANDSTIDAGLIGALKIGDTVWLDADGDGRYEPEIGEKGIAGIRIYLIGDTNNDGRVDTWAATRTDAEGKYRFIGLAPGLYQVAVGSNDLPNGLAPSYDLDGIGSRHYALGRLSAGADRLDFDFGYKVASSCNAHNVCWWASNSCRWNVSSMTVGGRCYSKSTLVCWLKKSVCGDASIALFQQVVAAKLNVAKGCCLSSAVKDAIKKADSWLCAHPVGSHVSANSSAWASVSAAYNTLDRFNNNR